MKWTDAKKIILQNTSVCEELKNNEAEYQIIEEIILARHEKRLTQKELAALVGTRQSNISRFESGNYNPTLEFLNKITKAVGKKLKVKIVS